MLADHLTEDLDQRVHPPRDLVVPHIDARAGLQVVERPQLPLVDIVAESEQDALHRLPFPRLDLRGQLSGERDDAGHVVETTVGYENKDTPGSLREPVAEVPQRRHEIGPGAEPGRLRAGEIQDSALLRGEVAEDLAGAPLAAAPVDDRRAAIG